MAGIIRFPVERTRGIDSERAVLELRQALWDSGHNTDALRDSEVIRLALKDIEAADNIGVAFVLGGWEYEGLNWEELAVGLEAFEKGGVFAK